MVSFGKSGDALVVQMVGRNFPVEPFRCREFGIGQFPDLSQVRRGEHNL